MLERYEENFDPEEFIKDFMAENKIKTKKKAVSILRTMIPLETYFQNKIKDKLKKEFPEAFVRKISQGSYSEGGIPDVLMIYRGHYFGFEVKRPVVGVASKLQEQTIGWVRKAGGTAEIVCWPEEAVKHVIDYDKCVMRIPKEVAEFAKEVSDEIRKGGA